MNRPKVRSAPRWFSAWRTGRVHAGADAADMGTAFGMEMSLLDPLSDTAASAERRPGWGLRLLTLRRRGSP